MGGIVLNYKIEKMGEFTVIGFEKIINNKLRTVTER